MKNGVTILNTISHSLQPAMILMIGLVGMLFCAMVFVVKSLCYWLAFVALLFIIVPVFIQGFVKASFKNAADR